MCRVSRSEPQTAAAGQVCRGSMSEPQTAAAGQKVCGGCRSVLGRRCVKALGQTCVEGVWRLQVIDGQKVRGSCRS